MHDAPASVLSINWAWCCIPAIPALRTWERKGQLLGEFKASLGYVKLQDWGEGGPPRLPTLVLGLYPPEGLPTPKRLSSFCSLE